MRNQEKQRKYNWSPEALRALEVVEERVEKGQTSVFENMGDRYAKSAHGLSSEIHRLGETDERRRGFKTANKTAKLLYDIHDQNYKRKARRITINTDEKEE